jgi:signal transduction histidine kinase
LKLGKDDIECPEDAQQFITKLTHDLRTPVNNIIGFANLLEIILAKDQNSTALNYLKIILQEAEHTVNLINTLSFHFKEMNIDIEIDKKNLLEDLLENTKKEHEKTVVGI